MAGYPHLSAHCRKSLACGSRQGGPGGVLLDVSESTNKQRTLEDYLHRAAILDRDPRGGAMALIFATEMAGLK